MRARRIFRGLAMLGDHDLGTLEPCEWPDLVVLETDPLGDILNTRRINAVYIVGWQLPCVGL